ncbi:MAG: SGNH/GDSL hydrolase family protein [Janthinobacterium lividum]
MSISVNAAFKGAVVLGLTALAASLPAFAGGGGTYIAVGDSAAYGYMNSVLTPAGGSGYAGYTQLYDTYLSTQAGAPVTLLNLGIVGETSTSLLQNSTGNSALNSNYSVATPESQFALLIANLTPDVTHVTVQIGANDMLALATNPAFVVGDPSTQQTLLNTTLATIAFNYNTLLTQISTLAPGADVQVLDYYNPYAALPASTLTQPYNDYLRTVSGPLIGGLNSVIAQEAALHHDTLVDLAGPFAGQESTLTRSSEYIPFDGTFVPNDHPTAAGYAVIAQQLETSPVPEASSAITTGLLLALGLGSLAVASRKKHRA